MSRISFRGKLFKINYNCTRELPVTRTQNYTNEYFTVTVLLRGRGACFVEHSRYPLEAGDITVLRANELRHFQYEQGDPHERISFYMSSSLVSPLWSYDLPLLAVFTERPAGIGNRITLEGPAREVFFSTLAEIRERISVPAGPVTEAELHLLLLRLLLCLHRGEPPAGGGSIDPVTGQICQYIQNHLAEKLSYKRLQEACYVSRYQLGAAFRRSTGLTLTEYIVQKRLLRASELILQGESYGSAARLAGFPNYSYFYKTFVKYRGVAPNQYFNTQKIKKFEKENSHGRPL